MCIECNLYVPPHDTSNGFKKDMCDGWAQMCYNVCVCVCVLSATHTHTGQLLSEHTAVTKPQFGLSGNTRMFLG